MKDRIKQFAKDHQVAILAATGTLVMVGTAIATKKVVDGQAIKAADHFVNVDGVNKIVVYLNNGKVVSLAQRPSTLDPLIQAQTEGA